MEISFKTRNKTTIWPNNPITEHIPWGSHSWKRDMYPKVLFFWEVDLWGLEYSHILCIPLGPSYHPRAPCAMLPTLVATLNGCQVSKTGSEDSPGWLISLLPPFSVWYASCGRGMPILGDLMVYPKPPATRIKFLCSLIFYLKKLMPI